MVKKSNNNNKSLPKTTDVEEVNSVEPFPGKKVTITIDIPKEQTNPHVLFALCVGQCNSLVKAQVDNYLKECNK